MPNTDQMLNRIFDIRAKLKDTKFTRDNPLHAAEMDLERKVLANDLRALEGEPRQYVALYY
jgi:hypothetical protein